MWIRERYLWIWGGYWVRYGDNFLFRVPEDKCHMVLPEIEEEAEEDTKLSLTSLLLGE